MNWDEENIRNKFENFEVPPSQNVWDNIEQELDANKGGGYRWPYYLLSTLVLMGSLLGGFYYWQSADKATNQNDLIAQEEAIALKKGIAFNGSKGYEKPLVFSKANYHSPSNSDQASEQNNTQNINANNNSKGTKRNNDQKKGPANKVNPSPVNNQKADQTANKANDLSDKPLDLKEDFTNFSISQSSTNIPKVNALTGNAEKIDNNADLDSLFNEERLDNKANKWGITVEAGLLKKGYQYAYPDGVMPSRPDQIESSEKGNWGYTLQIRGFWQFADKWRLETGIGYEKLNQQFRHTYNTPERGPNWDGEEDFHGAEDHDESQTGIQRIYSIEESELPPNFVKEVEIKHQNQFESFQAPLSIGYQVIDSRLNGFINTGVTFNYLHRADAKVIGKPENIVYNIDGKSTEPFRNMTLDYNLGLTGDYQLTERLSLRARTYGALGLFSSYNQDYPVEKTPYQVGLNIGVKYGF